MNIKTKLTLIVLMSMTVFGTVAYSVTASFEGEIRACVEKTTGATRIINFLTSRCRPNEDFISWNSTQTTSAGAGNVAFAHDSFLLLNSGDVVYADFISGQPKFISFAEYDKDNDMPNFSPLPLSVGRIAEWNYDSFLDKGGHFWKYKYSTNQWVDFGAAPEDVLAQCEDGIDNDGDELIDLKDADCTDPSDNSEEAYVIDVVAEFSTSNDSPNPAAIEVDDSTATNAVILTVADLEANGNSDITLEELPVSIYADSSSGISSIVKKVYLYEGNILLGSETISTSTDESGIIVFDNIDYTLAADDNIELTIKADINPLEGNYSQGDSIAISITPENIASSTIYDLNNNLLSSENKIGSVEGQPQAFYVAGIWVELVSTDENVVSVDGSNNDRAEFIIKFDITAIGQDAYIPNVTTATSFSTSATATAPSTSQGVGYGIQYTGTAPDATTVTGTTLTSTADEETLSFKIDEGSTETFTLKVVVQNDGSPDLNGNFRAILSGINFADTDTDIGDFVYTSNLVDDYKTDFATIAD